MLNIILNIIGALLIIYSIYIIKKDIENNGNKINEISFIEENTRKYYKHTEEIVSNFEELVDSKLKYIDIDNNSIQNNQNIEVKEKIKDERKSMPLSLNKDNKKIIELLEIGLTQEEIAKKLHKGIREVDIIIKMHKKNL